MNGKTFCFTIHFNCQHFSTFLRKKQEIKKKINEERNSKNLKDDNDQAGSKYNLID